MPFAEQSYSEAESPITPRGSAAGRSGPSLSEHQPKSVNQGRTGRNASDRRIGPSWEIECDGVPAAKRSDGSRFSGGVFQGRTTTEFKRSLAHAGGSNLRLGRQRQDVFDARRELHNLWPMGIHEIQTMNQMVAQ